MALSIDLTGRKALVTGVTRGIGAAIAQKLAQAGCNVAGCGLSNSETECVECFISGSTILIDGGRSALMQDPRGE